MRDYLTIDGSHGEGGGSIIRLSVALAALYSKPIKIVNIRKNRRNPGLRLQHCVGIKLIRDIMGGDLTGAEVGSSTVEYRPANNSQLTLGINHFKVKVTTAASIGLIFQALSLPLLSSKQKFTIEIEGGATYGQWAPSITYIQEVTLRYFRLFGIPNFTIEVLKHGFYPKGGAHVLLSFEPNEEKQGEVNLTKISTPLEKLKIFSLSAYSLKRYRVAERQADALKKEIIQQFPDTNINISINYCTTANPGSGITLWTSGEHPFGSSIVGNKGLPSEKVAKNIFNDFLRDWNAGGAVDKYMADQLIPLMALHPPSVITTKSPLTKHTMTNIWLTEQIIDVKFKTNMIQDGIEVITCEKQ